MRKGLSTILASVLITLIVIALSGTFLVYTNRALRQTSETGTETQQTFQQSLDIRLTVESVANSRVYVRNTGTRNITQSAVNFFIDDLLINHTLARPVEPGTVGTFYINGTSRLTPGEKTMRVYSGALSDSVRIKVERRAATVLELSFEEGSGTTTKDESGRENDGTLRDANTTNGDGDTPPLWVAGKEGLAVEFDGEDDYVDTPADYFAPTKGTVEMWVKFMDNNGLRTFVSTVPTDESSGWRFEYHKDPESVDRVNFKKWSPAVTASASNTSVTVGVWYKVAASWDNITIRVFVDGVEKANVNSTAPSPATLPLFIGKDSRADRQYFHGVIDEVRIFNDSYNPDELYVVNLVR